MLDQSIDKDEVKGHGQSSAHPNMLMTDTEPRTSKPCAYCLHYKPLSEFRRRTGKRSKGQSRRGACRDCRKLREAEARKAQPAPSSGEARENQPTASSSVTGAQPASVSNSRPSQGISRSNIASSPQSSTASPAERVSSALRSPSSSLAEHTRERKGRRHGAEQRRTPSHPRGPKPDPQDATALIPSPNGMILMRGHSDKGRRWHQEINLDLAVILVKEHAAVVVNRRTIRRLFSNRDFRSYILTRDEYTCYFCGLYGDTIDHLLPRAKGGHTTPVNCVCACNLCNQTKADQYVEEFMGR